MAVKMESVTLDGYNVSIAVTWHIANRIVSYVSQVVNSTFQSIVDGVGLAL